jgi:ABC-type enterochelin transport system permease subunit
MGIALAYLYNTFVFQNKVKNNSVHFTQLMLICVSIGLHRADNSITLVTLMTPEKYYWTHSVIYF